MIEGTWSGYSSSQRRVCHREFTNRAKFADAVRELRWIRFTDGTVLEINVTDIGDGRKSKPKPVNGYSTLIRECLYAGVNAVSDLPKYKAVEDSYAR